MKHLKSLPQRGGHMKKKKPAKKAKVIKKKKVVKKVVKKAKPAKKTKPKKAAVAKLKTKKKAVASKKVKTLFKFVGALSLECYLIHIHFVLDYIPGSFGYWASFFICLFVTLPLAWLLSKIVDYISNFIEKNKWTAKHI